MGVTNVNVNKAGLVKAALQKKGLQRTQSVKQDWEGPNGSIFLAKINTSKTAVSDQRATIADLNTRESITTLKPSGTKKKFDENSFQDVNDASSGRAAISSGKKAVSEGEKYNKEVENDEKIVNKYSKESVKLSKEIENNDKKFSKKLQAEQSAFDRDNQRIQKAVKQTEETQKEIDDAKHELDSLLASNSFKMGDGSSGNSDRIEELQSFIGSKVALMQQNGKTIYSLQRSQTRTLSRMNRTNKSYIRAQKTNQKNIKAQENKTSGIINTAQKIETISAAIQAGGQALGLAGDGLIALGEALSSTLFGSAAGAVLITIGMGMKKVGAIAEVVGQYGQTAANITKTAAYAAEGNLMGAMMSATTAVQTGAAAVKSTTQMGKTWSSINEQARAAKQNIAAQEAAKEAVNNELQKYATGKGLDVNQLTKEQQTEALGGLTKKQARKYMTGEIRNNMAINEAMSMDDLINLARNNVGDSLKNAKNAYNQARADATFDNALDKKVAELDKTLNKKFTRMAEYGDKRDWGKKLEALGGSVTNIATVFLSNQAVNEMTSYRPRKTIAPHHMDARTRRIMQRNQMYANRFNYV